MGLSLNFNSKRLSCGAPDDVGTVAIASVLEAGIEILDGCTRIHADFTEHISHHVEDLVNTCVFCESVCSIRSKFRQDARGAIALVHNIAINFTEGDPVEIDVVACY